MTGRFDQVLLDIAAEVEAIETRLKEQIIEAARAGDCDTVIAITEKWLTKPPAEVLAQALIPASPRR